MIADTISWVEERGGVRINCELQVRIHPCESNTILLLIPGVDGSVDGYENKYVTITETIQRDHQVAVVRIDNPYITSFHWESNVRRILQYIQDQSMDICKNTSYKIVVQAHSAGASVIAKIAHEYPEISNLLLINIAMQLDAEGIKKGLSLHSGDVTVLLGANDPSVQQAKELLHNVVLVENADHNFSGESFQHFLTAADTYLFRTKNS